MAQQLCLWALWASASSSYDLEFGRTSCFLGISAPIYLPNLHTYYTIQKTMMLLLRLLCDTACLVTIHYDTDTRLRTLKYE